MKVWASSRFREEKKSESEVKIDETLKIPNQDWITSSDSGFVFISLENYFAMRARAKAPLIPDSVPRDGVTM